MEPRVIDLVAGARPQEYDRSWSGSYGSGSIAFAPNNDFLFGPPRLPTVWNPMAVAAVRRAAAAIASPARGLTVATSPRLKGHLASKPVPIPPAVTVKLATGEPNDVILVEGPLGTQSFGLFPTVSVDFVTDPANARIVVSEVDPDRTQRAQYGLVRAMLNNMVVGVTTGWTNTLRLVGVGYRASQEPSPAGGERLRMKLGFSHDVVMDVPEGVSAEVTKPTEIVLKGINKHTVSQFAADIKRWRKPEPYKGKGIFVDDETIKIKNVKR